MLESEKWAKGSRIQRKVSKCSPILAKSWAPFAQARDIANGRASWLAQFWNLFFRKQQRFVISGAVQNMYDFDGISADAIENQEIAARALADSEMLVTRHQRVAARRVQIAIRISPAARESASARSGGCALRRILQSALSRFRLRQKRTILSARLGLELCFQTIKHRGACFHADPLRHQSNRGRSRRRALPTGPRVPE